MEKQTILNIAAVTAFAVVVVLMLYPFLAGKHKECEDIGGLLVQGKCVQLIEVSDEQ
jgi:hypothetical protein